jgi:hypothetical protein
MNRLNLRDFDLYSRRKVPNPAVAYIVEARLSQSLNDRFQVWRQEVSQDLGQPYEDLSAEDQRIRFRAFVDAEVQREVEETEHLFNQLVRERPRAASGYIRNMYVLEEARLAPRLGENAYDKAVAAFSDDFDTAKDYLLQAETVEDEVARRYQIITWANQLDVPTRQIGR